MGVPIGNRTTCPFPIASDARAIVVLEVVGGALDRRERGTPGAEHLSGVLAQVLAELLQAAQRRVDVAARDRAARWREPGRSATRTPPAHPLTLSLVINAS